MITMVYIMVNRIEHGDEHSVFKRADLQFEQNLTPDEALETFLALQRPTFCVNYVSSFFSINC